MFKAILAWFKSKPKTQEIKIPKYKYQIIYYPLAGNYYSKYNGYYLRIGYLTGIVETTEYIQYADHFSKRKYAEDLIALHKEQITKENVEIYYV